MSEWLEKFRKDRERGRFEGTFIPDNEAWLRANKHNYDGLWVALRHGRLLGADKGMITLQKRLEAEGKITDDRSALFVRMGDDWMVPPIEAPVRNAPSD